MFCGWALPWEPRTRFRAAGGGLHVGPRRAEQLRGADGGQQQHPGHDEYPGTYQ